MARKKDDANRSNEGLSDQMNSDSGQNRRGFLKLLGTTAAAAGLGTKAMNTATATSDDPFDYVESLVLNGEYPDTVSRDDATVVTGSASEFLDAVESASSGDVVFVPGDAQIDLTGHDEINVPGGVTIASDRGVNGSAGGLLYTDVKALPLLQSNGKDIRLTGLRLCGNHPEGYHEFTEWSESASGFWVSHTGAEVDNCEIFGWGYAGVAVRADGCHVHHCHIHDNEEDGLGYGVHCGSGHATIEFNYFLHNRHAIAGGGDSAGYTARYNLVGPEADDHAFDMHEPGGNRIVIHHNKFEYDETFHGSAIEAVKIRGVPNDSCKISENWFHHDSPPGDAPVTSDGEAINQSGSDGEWQNLTFSSNYYGPDAVPGYDSSLLKQNDPVGGSVDDSAEPATTTRPFEIRADANSGEVTYEFTVDGQLSQAPDDVERNDNVTQNDDGTWTATGYTGNGYSDYYEFSGSVVTFTADPQDMVTVYDDGTDVTEELLASEDSVSTRPFEIHTAPNSGQVTYEFTVDGQLAQAPDDVERNDNVTDNGDGTWTATGFTGNGYTDTYEFSGDIVEFTASPAAMVTLYDDGSDVTTGLIGPEMTHAIRFDASGSEKESAYSFEVTDAVSAGPGTSLEDADVIDGTTVEGTLQDDIDVYHFAGDLLAFDFDGSMTVNVEELN